VDKPSGAFVFFRKGVKNRQGDSKGTGCPGELLRTNEDSPKHNTQPTKEGIVAENTVSSKNPYTQDLNRPERARLVLRNEKPLEPIPRGQDFENIMRRIY
jgi:hypothetical protein